MAERVARSFDPDLLDTRLAELLKTEHDVLIPTRIERDEVEKVGADWAGEVVAAVLHAELAAGRYDRVAKRAAALAGAMRLATAAPALLRCIERPDEDLLGWEAFRALEAIGADALEDLLAAFEANRGNLLVRRRIGELLAYAGVRDRRIRDGLLELLTEDPAVGANWLASYGDRSVLPALLRAFDATEVDLLRAPPAPNTFELSAEPHEDAFMIASAITSLGGNLSEAQQAKLDEVLRRRDEAFDAFVESTAPMPDPTLPPGERQSRNTHCRCGSGKKYKRCHLASDVAGASTKAP